MEERSDRIEKGDEESKERISTDMGEPVIALHAEEMGAHTRRPKYNLTALLLTAGLFGAVIGGLTVGVALPYLYGGTPKAVFSDRQIETGGTVREIIQDSGSPGPVTAVADKLNPSVVNIGVSQGPQDAIHSTLMDGVGSGVIYTSDGHIITNNHVVEGAREVFVTIGTDADEIPARVVATDPDTDLAVLKVNRTGLPAAEFGSTSGLKVGEPAVAIGSPFGFEYTVTSGIISALHRNVTVPDGQTGVSTTYTDLIQTDAAINPGNSGGVLSDATGKVIGINTLIISSSGTSEGVGFAIPVETAKSVADQLIKSGRASHPFIGVAGRDVPDIPGESSSRTIDEGVIITDVTSGGPAAKAGLRQDDILTAIDGTPIDDTDELIAAIRQRNVGDTIDVTYYRNDRRLTAQLTLVEKPS